MNFVAVARTWATYFLLRLTVDYTPVFVSMLIGSVKLQKATSGDVAIIASAGNIIVWVMLGGVLFREIEVLRSWVYNLVYPGVCGVSIWPHLPQSDVLRRNQSGVHLENLP